MTGQIQSSPAEQVSVDAPVRRVRRLARAQVAAIGVGSAFHLALPVARTHLRELAGTGPLSEGQDVLMRERPEARQLGNALGHNTRGAVMARDGAWRQLRYESEAKLAVIDLLVPRAGAWCMLTELHADGAGRHPRPGLFALTDTRGRLVTPEAFDVVTEAVLDRQVGSRLDALLQQRTGAPDGSAGPVVLAPAQQRDVHRATVNWLRRESWPIGDLADQIRGASDRTASGLVSFGGG